MNKPKLSSIIAVLCCLAVLSSLVLATSPLPISPSNLLLNTNGQLSDIYGTPVGLNTTWLNTTAMRWYSSVPNTSGWGIAETGIEWYDAADDSKEYWNGSAVVLEPSIGGGSINGTYTLPFTYLMFKSGSTYYAEGRNGGILSSNTNSSLVERAADTAAFAAGGGIIWLTAGTYTIADTGWYLHKTNSLIGEGSQNTILTISGNGYNAITIDPAAAAACWQIIGLKILMNHHNGHGIYSSYATPNSVRATPKLDSIVIEDVVAGYAGIYMLSASNMRWSMVRVTYAGTGVYLGHGTYDSADYGNSIIDFLDLNPIAINSVGLDIVCPVYLNGNNSFNLATFRHLQIVPANSPYFAGTVGIRITNETYVTMYDTDIENVETGILLNASLFDYFYNTRIYQNAATKYGIRLVGNLYGNRFLGGEITVASVVNQIPYSDESTSGNTNHNLVDGGLMFTPSTANFGTETDLGIVYMSYANSTSNYYPSTNTGVTSCVSGTVITHKVLTNGVITPEAISLDFNSYINATAFIIASVSAKTTTTFTVGVYIVNLTTGAVVAVSASTAPASVSITWTAEYKVAT